MFEIRIGTILPSKFAQDMVPALKDFGFESYELSCGAQFRTDDVAGYAARLMDALEGTPISALGCYNNPLSSEDELGDIIHLMDSAHLFGCDTISVFAGSAPGKTLTESIPVFKKVFGELCARAEDKGLKIAIENCAAGTTWRGGGSNIGYCPDAWEMMFDAVPNECIGLEWEPCHALMQLMDPIAQLRKWVGRVRHVHGKDGTVAWDVIREHGISGAQAFGWNRTPGFGDTNWNDVCTILMQHGYKGFIDIEGYHDPVHYDDGEWSAQKRALDYLRDCRGGRVFIEGPGYKGYQPPKKRA